MCAGAISFARIGKVIYAASDPKGGAVLHGPRFFGQKTCHWRPEVEQDAANDVEAGDLLREFFRTRR
jgi:tRNA(Arg) A34 adenosine deaminase TadA